MALKNYNHTTVKNVAHTLCTADTGREIAIVSLLVSAGFDAGTLTVQVKDGGSVVFEMAIALAEPYDAALIDSKIFLPAGYSLVVIGDEDGLTVMASADDSAVIAEM